MIAVGTLLREWRERRKLSQLELAMEAGISTRHLSFVETGRSLPSRQTIVALADELQVPLREQNQLLLAAGFAPRYPRSDFQSPDLQPARDAVRTLLGVHEPFPAVAIDRDWNLVEANAGARTLLHVVDPQLLAAPANVLRISLHPAGLAPHIRNLAEWRSHLFARLNHDIATSNDDALRTLLRELQAYAGEAGAHGPEPEASAVFVPLCLRLNGMDLSFISTVTKFGTARDVTLDELSVESFFPADEATRAALA